MATIICLKTLIDQNLDLGPHFWGYGPPKMVRKWTSLFATLQASNFQGLLLYDVEHHWYRNYLVFWVIMGLLNRVPKISNSCEKLVWLILAVALLRSLIDSSFYFFTIYWYTCIMINFQYSFVTSCMYCNFFGWTFTFIYYIWFFVSLITLCICFEVCVHHLGLDWSWTWNWPLKTWEVLDP